MLAIKDARIYTITGGVIERGTILVEGGKIVAVGPNVKVPAGSEVIDASGRIVTPGLIDAQL
ncbi:MAG: amidohydrolase, partial [Firmicutes bacterium]|nr:amidohydrolase [Bacillota bacterium]